MQITLARTGLAVVGLGLGAAMLAGCAQTDASTAGRTTPYHRPAPHLVKRIEPVAPAAPQARRAFTAAGDPAPPFVAARP